MIYEYGSDGEKFERQRQLDLGKLFKELESWQSVFRGRLQQWTLHGPSKARRAGLAEAAEKCGAAVDALMASTPELLG